MKVRRGIKSANNPFLECPNCGEVVISLKERAERIRPHIFICPYCGCRYRIPGVVQNIQIVSVLAWSLPLAVVYEKCLSTKMQDWVWAITSINKDIISIFMDIVVYAFILVVAVWLACAVGTKLAYKYPLRKV